MAGVAAIVGAVSAATSAGVSIYGAATADAPAGGVSVPRGFDMPNKAQSAMAAFQGIQNLPGQNIPGQVTPQYEQIAQQLVNNPYAQMLMQGANSAAPFGQNAALDAYGVGQQATAAGGALVPYANQIAQTAFDPQNALYAQLQQRTVDQARAGQAARGVATTPYGASLENDAMRKFNIDWQNAQLGRQIAGGQGAGQTLESAVHGAGGGAALADTSVGNYLKSSGIPYSTFSTVGQGQLGGLNSLVGGVSGAQGLAMNPVQAYLNYLGVANQSGQVANQAAQVGLNQANLGFQQSQTLGGQLGAGISGVGSALGNKDAWNWLNSFSNPNQGNMTGLSAGMGGLAW